MNIAKQFENHIRKSGYTVSGTVYPNIRECIKEENDETAVIQLVDMTTPDGADNTDNTDDADDTAHAVIDSAIIREQAENVTAVCGGDNVRVMTLIFADDPMKAHMAAQDDPMCWILDTSRHRLIIEEGKVNDFYGLRNSAVNFLIKVDGQSTGKEKPSPAALILVAVNVLVFLLSIFMPGFVLYGMMDYDMVSGGQLYRLFTAMFLHSGVDHITGNMLSLYFMGALVEKTIGSLRFMVIYMLSGIAGNVASYYYEMLSGSRYTSVGASGAIYGILGALIFLVLKKSSGLNITGRRLLIAVAFCLYSSFAMPGIDYAAHIGGLIAGFIVCALIMLPGTINKREESI